MPRPGRNPHHDQRPPSPTVTLAGLVMLLLLTGLLSACDISKPALPSFDSRVTIPLGSRRLTVAEGADSDSSLAIDPDGAITFNTSGVPDTLALGMDLSLEVQGQHIKQAIGSFGVAAPEPLVTVASLQEVWPDAAAAAGHSVPVPAFSFTISSGDLELSGINACTLSSGIATVRVASSWPLGISGSGNSDPLSILLLDGDTGQTVLTINAEPVPAGGTITAVTSLSGLVLPGRLRLVMSGHGDGSADPVYVAGDEPLTFTLSFSNLIATSADAVIEPQTFNLSFVTDFSRGDDISSARLDSGNLALRLHNQLPMSASVALVWNQVLTPGGSPLTASAVLNAGGDAVLNIPFADCRIEGQGEILNSLTAQVTARISGSEGQPVTLSSTQGLTADLEPGILSFSTINGCFAPSSWELGAQSQQLEYPDNSEGFEFTCAALSVQLDNSAALGADLDLTISGTSSQGDPVTLEIRDRINPADQGAAKTTLMLDEHNSDILHFLNSRPRLITLEGTLSLTAGANCGTVAADDHLVVSWDLVVPLAVRLNGATLSGEADSLGLDPDLQATIGDHAGGAEFQSEVLNHLPSGLQLMVLAAPDPADLPDHPGLVIGPIRVPSAQIDAATGEVVAGVTSHPVITLSADEARYFGTPNLHTMFQVVLPSSGNQTVRVLSTDYLEVSGLLKLDLRAGGGA